uniref:Transmembrane protein n=1 Tax=Ascaris lumbricoides TaxID=6252 RepID=A0A0M3I3X1_ASCLU
MIVVGLGSYLTIAVSLFIAYRQVSAVPFSYVKLLFNPMDFIYDSGDGSYRPTFYVAERDLPPVSRSLAPMLFERSERATNSGDEKIYQIRHVGDLPMFRFG